jgi:hypothetical protein
MIFFEDLQRVKRLLSNYRPSFEYLLTYTSERLDVDLERQLRDASGDGLSQHHILYLNSLFVTFVRVENRGIVADRSMCADVSIFFSGWTCCVGRSSCPNEYLDHLISAWTGPKQEITKLGRYFMFDSTSNWDHCLTTQKISINWPYQTTPCTDIIGCRCNRICVRVHTFETLPCPSILCTTMEHGLNMLKQENSSMQNHLKKTISVYLSDKDQAPLQEMWWQALGVSYHGEEMEDSSVTYSVLDMPAYPNNGVILRRWR